VALIAFNSGARVLQPLTSDRAALELALGQVRAADFTRLDLGIRAARIELGSGRRHSGSEAVMVILSDGRANPVPVSVAVLEAEDAKALGQVLFTVGVGSDLDADALAVMASQSDYYFVTQDGEGLAPILTSISVIIPCPPATYWPGASSRRSAGRPGT
jgi:Mg-chelatase subunit ChlD